MTEKIKNEIKIKARQITDDIISFMQELDTVTNEDIDKEAEQFLGSKEK